MINMRKGITQSVAVVLILLAVGGFFLWKGGSFFQFSVLSISNVNYVSNDPDIGGPAWLITVAQDQKDDNLILTLNKDLMIDSIDKVKANRDAKLTFSVDKMEARYVITYQNTNIEHMNYYKTINLFNKDNCMNGKFSNGNSYGGNFYAWGKTGFDYYCFYTTKSAGYGLLSDPVTGFETTVKLESSGQSYTTKISSLTTTVASIKDPITGKVIGRVNWIGSLSTGEESPKASSQQISASYSYSTNGWKTINDQAYVSWRDFSFIGCTGGTGTTIGTRDFVFCVDEWNRKEATALSGKSLINQAEYPATVTGSSLLSGLSTSGQVILPLSKLVMFPLLTVKLDAKLVDTVSIEELVGKPRIVSLTTNEFQTGSTGYITAEVYNYGTATGSFEAWAVCTSPFSQAGTNQFLTVGVGQTGFTNIPITSNVVEKTSKSCTVYVRDRNQPANFDSKTVTVTSNPIVLCNPTSTRCNGNLIEQCNQAGSGWTVTKTCDFGCEIKDNQAVCKGEKPPVCGNGVCETGETKLGCPKDCGGGEDWTKWLVVIIPTLLGGLLLYSMKRDMFWALTGAITGGIAGFIVKWISELPWYVKLFGTTGIVITIIIAGIVALLGVTLIREIIGKKFK